MPTFTEGSLTWRVFCLPRWTLYPCNKQSICHFSADKLQIPVWYTDRLQYIGRWIQCISVVEFNNGSNRDIINTLIEELSFRRKVGKIRQTSRYNDNYKWLKHWLKEQLRGWTAREDYYWRTVKTWEINVMGKRICDDRV